MKNNHGQYLLKASRKYLIEHFLKYLDAENLKI